MKPTPSIPRSHATVLLAAMALHLIHQWWYREWTIDDAAISYAYARNIAAGWGPVPWPGGEWVEGFSNPLWVALIVVGELVGLDGFHTAKWMVAALGAATLPLVYLIARRALPGDDGRGALVAPMVLGLSAHHAIWSASCLENALFAFLVSGGILSALTDLDEDRWPRSALWFLAISLTRPEGILYAAATGIWFAMLVWSDGRGWRPIAAWLGLFWAPYGGWLALRWWAFAWPLPNTYYAKMELPPDTALRWYGRGWVQMRDYADRLWQGWFLPIYGLAMLGHRRRWLAGVGLAVAVVLLIPGPALLKGLPWWPDLPDPLPWIRVRLAVLTIAALAASLVVLDGAGGRARSLTWILASVAVFFAVASNGDWMDGLRWMSFLAPQLAVLFAVGTVEAMRELARWLHQPVFSRAGWAMAALLTGLHLPPNAAFTTWYRPIWDDYPELIAPRVRHTEAFARKVFLDEPVRPLDMDMGATLMWSDQRPLDMAGLVDVAMAHHTYEDRAFIEEYVFEEVRPHVAHVHGHWASQSKLLSYPEFKRQYFKYPGYPEGDRFHDGLYGRRDLVMNEAAVDSDQTVEFAGGVLFRGLRIPSPEVGSGMGLYIDTAWSTRNRRPASDGFAVTAFLHRDGRVHSWDLPMGYTMSGYPAYPVHWWNPMEAFRGQYALDLPELPPGTWELGFVVRDGQGRVLPAAEPSPNPVLAIGEIRVQTIEILSPDRALAAADADRRTALGAASEGRCEEAEATWVLARRHVPREIRWIEEHSPEIHAAFARCWTTPPHHAASLARAHRWFPGSPALRQVKQPVADTLSEEGRAALAAGDWDLAYTRFREVLSFSPERASVRRLAEEARDLRLGIRERPTAP